MAHPLFSLSGAPLVLLVRRTPYQAHPLFSLSGGFSLSGAPLVLLIRQRLDDDGWDLGHQVVRLARVQDAREAAHLAIRTLLRLARRFHLHASTAEAKHTTALTSPGIALSAALTVVCTLSLPNNL